MAARFRFSAESAKALGFGADTPADQLADRLGFPSGVKVTSVKPDGDGLVLNLSGGGVDGDVTGEFWIGTDDEGQPRISFRGFTPATAEPAAGAATTTEG